MNARPNLKAPARLDDIPGIKRASDIVPALSIQGVARALEVSGKTVRRMVASGALPPADFYVGTGRRRQHARWRRETIEAFQRGEDGER